MRTFLRSKRNDGAGMVKKSVRAAMLGVLLAATAIPVGSSFAHTEDVVTEARLLKQLYLIGLSRVARGDPAGAVAPFQVITEVAPELTEAHHLLAAAMVLADFRRRERALPIIARALAVDPSHPLYNVVHVMADPALSRLRDDGALYLSTAGASKVEAALPALARRSHGYNARYLAPLLDGAEATDDPAFPRRLPHFADKLGPRGSLVLAKLSEPVPFGRFFAVSITDERFAPRVRETVASLPAGVVDLAAATQTAPNDVTAMSGQATMELLLDRSAIRRH
jgi:hypothetical protein